MQATITHTTEHSPIGFGGAFARQFRFLWASRRPLLLGVALLALLVLAGDPWTNDAKMRLLTVWPMWISLVPIFWAFAVFHNEGPDSRLYFWAHPTGRARHTMARLAAGLAWMWIMYGVLLLAGWAFGVVDGDAWQMTEIGLAAWVNYFTGPLLFYLMISIFTVPSDYPIRWFFGVIFAVPLLISLLDNWIENAGEIMEQVFAPLVNEDWGLFVTTAGAFVEDIEALDVMLRRMTDPTYAGTAHFDMAQLWGVATPLWILGLVALVAFIATRHPDTLPKLRSLKFWG
jgi:hypothetical protein